jgi:hypothetical protein
MKDSGPCFARYLNPEVDGYGYQPAFFILWRTYTIRGYDQGCGSVLIFSGSGSRV